MPSSIGSVVSAGASVLGGAASTGAQVAVAAANTAAAMYIADKQMALARDYYNLAKEMRDFWNNTYRPCEANAANEACSAPLYTPQYQTTAGRYVASVRQQFRGGMDNATRAVGRYCTGLSAIMVRDMAIAEASAVGNAMNFAYRYEEARKQALDDVRWSRRHTTLALGRGLLGTAMGYGNASNNMYSAIGAQAMQSMGSAMAGLQRSMQGSQRVTSNGSGTSGVAQYDGLANGGYTPSLNNIDPYRIASGSTNSAAGMSTSVNPGFGMGSAYDTGPTGAWLNSAGGAGESNETEAGFGSLGNVRTLGG